MSNPEGTNNARDNSAERYYPTQLAQTSRRVLVISACVGTLARRRWVRARAILPLNRHHFAPLLSHSTESHFTLRAICDFAAEANVICSSGDEKQNEFKYVKLFRASCTVSANYLPVRPASGRDTRLLLFAVSFFPSLNDKYFVLARRIGNPGDLTAIVYCNFHLLVVPASFAASETAGYRVTRNFLVSGARTWTKRMIPWEGHALNCTDTTVVSLLDASFLAYTRTHSRLPARRLDLLSRLVRQKVMHAVDIPEIVARYPSRLVPYHTAIKMEVCLYRSKTHEYQL